MLLAHFTPAELPGTLAVLLIGVVLGAALVGRSLRAAAGALLALGVLATLASLGDSGGWSEPVRLAIDAGFLLALVPAAALCFRTAAR
jgi:hypothetical protein